MITRSVFLVRSTGIPQPINGLAVLVSREISPKIGLRPTETSSALDSVGRGLNRR